MSIPPYERLIDSNLPWLGKVPEHWEVRPLGSCFRERREKVSDEDYPPLSVTKHGIVPQLENAAKTDDNDNRRLVRVGDFVINSRSDRKGSSGMAKMNGSVSLINTVIEPTQDILIEFSHHLFRSEAFQEEFYLAGKGIVADLWSTNYSSMKQIVLALPPLKEQKAIASFLDVETSKIDALVSEQRRLIELLKEKRQAVISHAVTKGLNPNAPMKPSGIPWLGDVPEHWEVTRIGYLSLKIGSGKTPSGGADNYHNQGILFIRSQNVYDEGLRLDDAAYITRETDEEMAVSRLQPGDVLLNITGASLGRTCIVPDEFPPANVNQHVCIIRLMDDTLREFVSIALKSLGLKGQFDFAQNGAAREGLNYEQVSRLRLAIPRDYQERNEIVAFVCEQSSAFTALIAEAERAIELLQERRTALISAAVTGKIDVGSLAPQESSA